MHAFPFHSLYMSTLRFCRANKNNCNTTLCSKFSVFLKPFSVNWDRRTTLRFYQGKLGQISRSFQITKPWKNTLPSLLISSCRFCLVHPVLVLAHIDHRHGHTYNGSSNLPIRTGHPQFELQEGQLDDLEGVPKKGVEDAVSVGGVEGREVGGSEAAVVESIALVHHAVTACRHGRTETRLVSPRLARTTQTAHQHTFTSN